jgi:rhomboid domain-containing protein 1
MRNNRQKSNQAVFLLITELMSNEKLPPVTLGFIALQVLIYLEYFFQFPSLDVVCLSAYSILYQKEWIRLITSTLFHGDDWHLYYNMTSFAIKGRTLEKRFGSVYFFSLLVIFSVCCSLVLVGLEVTASYAFGETRYIHSCAVGFSGVIFALKVLTTHYLPSGTTYMFDTVPVPSKYIYWAELILISVVSPNASFAGKLNVI